ncbi:hypothetical protein FH972_003270 [Carpinus fangiana]|uniref:Uncharacterized protein n=1 Tax=Carpinus fangiana TaxID=176857 RepID=A0A5N6QJC5_9ROSI|nr:hypothetical protein FH972_003270 [Carpinus fangiana]
MSTKGEEMIDWGFGSLILLVTGSEGKLMVMGGRHPTSYELVKDVFVYEFTFWRWRRGKDMPETWSFFASGELGGQIIIAGGHDGSNLGSREAPSRSTWGRVSGGN